MSKSIRWKVYKYQGNYYRVHGTAEFKHPETREWIHSIAYRLFNESINETWIREYNEFIKIFEEATEEEAVHNA